MNMELLEQAERWVRAAEVPISATWDCTSISVWWKTAVQRK